MGIGYSIKRVQKVSPELQKVSHEEWNRVENRVQEAQMRASCLTAMLAIPIVDTGDQKKAVSFLRSRSPCTICNQGLSPTTNHDIVVLRREIEEFARTNALVAAEIEALKRLPKENYPIQIQ